MMRALVVFEIAILALGLTVVLIVLPGLALAQPPIPHPLEGRQACLTCHETGVGGAPPVPDTHAGRTDRVCQLCHKWVSAEAVATPEPEATTPPLVPPPIPHSLEGRDACLACHEAGVGGAPQVPKDHAGRTNDICQNCHQPAVVAAPTTPVEPTATITPTSPAAPPQIPHPVAGRELCLSCHETGVGGAPQFPADHAGRSNEGCQFCHQPIATAQPTAAQAGPPTIPHSLEGRDNCRMCHETGVGGAPQFPADHADRTNDTCQGCHQPAAMAQPTPTPTPTTPPRPLPTPIQYPFTPGQNTCLDCHKALGGKHEKITTAWQGSIHASRGIRCPDCHGGDPAASDAGAAMSPQAGYIGVPAKADIPSLCGSCHARVELMRQYDLPIDQYAKYLESQHGQLLTQGDQRVATCFDCHDGHGTREVNDPSTSVYPTNVPGLCASCHSDKGFMRPYGIPTNQYELYKESVHGIALLKKQDLRAPSCATCHGTHGAAPPGFEEVASVCGGCHTATQDYYLQGRHGAKAPGMPECVTCHGHHDVMVPSEEMFLGDQPRHCGSCHAPDTPIGGIVADMYQALAGAAGAVEEAEAMVARAAARGLIVTVEEERLREAKTSLTIARAAQHTVQLATAENKTEEARSIATEVRDRAEKAIAETVFRRQAMVVAVASIALISGLLYYAKRQLDEDYFKRVRKF
ncbi:MAG: cytochrome c3 family protein [Anaerolineae bacterium]